MERIQNYYQYKDAESKFYQLLKGDKQDVAQTPTEQVSQEAKPKKSRKNKKKDSTSSETATEQVQAGDGRQKTKSISKDESKEDVSARTDSGIADEPPSESSAAKKKSKSKKQREKKAAAAAAAQQQKEPEPQETKESQAKEKIVIDLTPVSVAAASTKNETKPKDKKKKSKSSSTEAKTKEDNDKNGVTSASSNLVSEIAKARQHIKSSLERVDGASALSGSGGELLDRISSLEKDNANLHGVIDGLQKLVISLEGRLNKLEGGSAPAKSTQSKPTPAPSKPAAAADDDDDVDLFGSEEDDEEAEKVKEERLKAYAEKKSKKPALIAKSSILLDVKPWDDETDMKEMEKAVRTIAMDGLLWGVSKLVPLAYGIKKLQILCVIEDDKVSVDELQEKMQEFEDFVQSVDIAAFNKI